MSRKTWDVNVQRDGKFWLIQVPGIEGGTQARTLNEVDEMSRDFIAGMNDVLEASFDIHIEIQLPAEVVGHLAEAQRLREQAAIARSQSAEESRIAARLLKSSGMTVREIGRALKVSHQRAQQLVSS
ncbi:hypothetical protein GCM10027022_15030 [Alpinimonas psychrophila]|uniref:Antitoxin HicB n=1 Tax=Alpinimonas psychrophila TaxID=748908 RepID=A0A7W3JVU1_9MICO|nr:hypothetical protein [Alpinimonas psychrophila]MBA8829605.1 hypothetical protein [Alpinimonas psychrophila]MBA8830077.1 hypothetical protein [Alpinimonas psychrophila]